MRTFIKLVSKTETQFVKKSLVVHLVNFYGSDCVILDKFDAQNKSINKAQQVIQKLNEVNGDLSAKCEAHTARISQLEAETNNLDSLKNQHSEAEKDIDTLNKQISLYKSKFSANFYNFILDTIEEKSKIELKCKQQVADIEAEMRQLQCEFQSSCKDLEAAQAFNDSVNQSLAKVQEQTKILASEKQSLADALNDKDTQYNNLLQEIDIREDEKEKIIDHIKKQAENTVAFYRNKYERMTQELGH